MYLKWGSFKKLNNTDESGEHNINNKYVKLKLQNSNLIV